MYDLEELKSQYDRAEYLQNILIDRATGGEGHNAHYQHIRQELLDTPTVKDMVPRWLIINRSTDQFWQYIKNKYGTYQERRDFIWKELNPLLSFLESGVNHPAQKSISDALTQFDNESIRRVWEKALERKSTDPEGAITISRTILESVCKHILDERKIPYNGQAIEMSELYKLTAKELNLSPEQHNEQIFKQILGGCSGIVNGLGSLRNKLGDAHGQGKQPVRPQTRHAELAVNLAGAMALFLVSTHEATKT